MTVVASTAVVHQAIAHDSARLHVTGEATYVDDIQEPEGTLHVALGLSSISKGRITSLELDAVRAISRVSATTAKITCE
jgi:xanthine dehydrogenase large subunit